MQEKRKWYVEYLPFIFTGVLCVICIVIEILHIEFSRETREEFYSYFGTISLVLSASLNLVYGRRYGLSWVASIGATFVSFYLIFSLLTQVGMRIEVYLTGTGSVAAYRSAIFLLPACYLLSRLFKKDTFMLCDYLTPYFFYHHGTVTIACWIVGCCAGDTNSWGLFNPILEQMVFPLQPCIILLGVCTSLWGIWYARKKHYQTGGRIFAYSLIIYGIGRYLLEFISDDMHILGVLTWNSFCSLAMIMLGSILIYLINKKNRNLEIWRMKHE